MEVTKGSSATRPAGFRSAVWGLTRQYGGNAARVLLPRPKKPAAHSACAEFPACQNAKRKTFARKGGSCAFLLQPCPLFAFAVPAKKPITTKGVYVS